MLVTAETTALWPRYVRTREPRIREALILAYTPLVKYVVDRLAISLPAVLDTEDLISYGIIGLIDAVERFDPDRGFKFETFAIPRIRGTIIDQLRALDWLPRSARQRAKEIERGIQELRSSLGRMPTDEEVAAYLQMDLDRYHAAVQEAATITLSLDHVLSMDDDDSPLSLADLVEDRQAVSLLGAAERNELLGALIRAIEELPERDRLVIALYYNEELTMKEISRVLEISESRVCQLHARAVLKLRAALASFREPAGTR
ncbi:MAG: RNA polymerase sigma factor WhiG [Dehalococcoidia bacterium]|nr:MAG: RNA polymerase sigma factor WhiG [Dehalococcoidia bacterium]